MPKQKLQRYSTYKIIIGNITTKKFDELNYESKLIDYLCSLLSDCFEDGPYNDSYWLKLWDAHYNNEIQKRSEHILSKNSIISFDEKNIDLLSSDIPADYKDDNVLYPTRLF